MSIREIGGKIKGFLDNDRLFYALLIVVVGCAAFGLGRLSVRAPESAPVVQKITPRPSTSVAASEIATEPSALDASIDTPKVGTTTESARGAYVGSKNSDKYHLPWCSGASRISEVNKVWFTSKEEAEKAGYKPAGNCPGI